MYILGGIERLVFQNGDCKPTEAKAGLKYKKRKTIYLPWKQVILVNASPYIAGDFSMKHVPRFEGNKVTSKFDTHEFSKYKFKTYMKIVVSTYVYMA